MKNSKFRIWDNKKSKFRTDFYLNPEGEVCLWESCRGSSAELNTQDKKDFIVQEFTGLKDKNGKEIFEGDIIKYSFKPCDLGEPETGTGEVYYDEESACFLFDRAYSYDFMIAGLNIQVVGNIFQ